MIPDISAILKDSANRSDSTHFSQYLSYEGTPLLSYMAMPRSANNVHRLVFFKYFATR